MNIILWGFVFLACSCACLFAVKLYKLTYYSVEKTCYLKKGILKEYLDYPGGSKWKYPVVELDDGEEIICNLVKTTREILPVEGQVVHVWVNDQSDVLKGYLDGHSKTINGSGPLGLCLSFSFSMLLLIGFVCLTYGVVVLR